MKRSSPWLVDVILIVPCSATVMKLINANIYVSISIAYNQDKTDIFK